VMQCQCCVRPDGAGRAEPDPALEERYMDTPDTAGASVTSTHVGVRGRRYLRYRAARLAG
jgi:hypothetical protein